ncbi:MAG: hypothetical protein GAK45_00365 [Pseudomonas citronellolis]|nr:MAG: hypothetical protein GAK45_00365 [Pseudomonas citronellolis]
MLLEGSCHCGAVHFSLNSAQPCPYQRCYCSICRKTQGGGGYAINLGGEAASLKVSGRKHINIYHAKLREPGQRTRISGAERHFCSICGSGLWLYDPQWPELIHPFASAIDSALPVPPEHTHLLLRSRAPWVELQAQPGDLQFNDYPEESLAQWHERHDLAR